MDYEKSMPINVNFKVVTACNFFPPSFPLVRFSYVVGMFPFLVWAIFSRVFRKKIKQKKKGFKRNRKKKWMNNLMSAWKAWWNQIVAFNEEIFLSLLCFFYSPWLCVEKICYYSPIQSSRFEIIFNYNIIDIIFLYKRWIKVFYNGKIYFEISICFTIML